MRINSRSLLIPVLFVFFFAVAGVKAQTGLAPTDTALMTGSDTTIEVVDSAGNKVLTGSFGCQEHDDFKVDLVSTGYQEPAAPVITTVSNCGQPVSQCGGCGGCHKLVSHGCGHCETSCGHCGGCGHCAEPHGTAKVDYDKEECACEREIKVKVKDLQCCASYTVLINGVAATSFTTDHHGKAEVKLEKEAVSGQQAQIVTQGQ